MQLLNKVGPAVPPVDFSFNRQAKLPNVT